MHPPSVGSVQELHLLLQLLKPVPAICLFSLAKLPMGSNGYQQEAMMQHIIDTHCKPGCPHTVIGTLFYSRSPLSWSTLVERATRGASGHFHTTHWKP